MDYGKLAYMKVEDINRRLNNYAKIVASNKGSRLVFNRQCISISTVNNSIDMWTYLPTTTDIEIELIASTLATDSVSINARILLNDVVCLPFTCQLHNGIVGLINCGTTVTQVQGLCHITLQFDTNVDFELNSLMLSVYGQALQKYQRKPTLCYTNDSGVDYYGIVQIHTLTVYQTNLSTAPTIIDLGQLDINQAQIQFINGVLHLIYTINGKLYVSSCVGTIGSGVLIASNISQFCCYSVNGVLYVFIVVKNKLYLITVDSQYHACAPIPITLPYTNALDSISCYVTADSIYLVTQDNKITRLYRTSSVQQPFDMLSALSYGQQKGCYATDTHLYCTIVVNSLCLSTDTLLTDCSTTALSKCYCEDALQTGANRLILQDGLTIHSN
ncbi:MAG: hypothetical protein PHW00_02760 [Clostridia bacterium]|nr:hypothetical protein [Clostridia bacterium]